MRSIVLSLTRKIILLICVLALILVCAVGFVGCKNRFKPPVEGTYIGHNDSADGIVTVSYHFDGTDRYIYTDAKGGQSLGRYYIADGQIHFVPDGTDGKAGVETQSPYKRDGDTLYFNNYEFVKE